MILVMDAQETQILGQVLTGLGTVLLSGAFGFLTYLVKKHMSSIVAWIDSYIGAKNFDKIVTFIKASIAEAEKDGIADDLTGEAKHNKVVQEVETKFSSTLKSLGIDESALEKLVEGYWASMADTLTTAYTNTEFQKKLDEANKAKAEADAAKAEAEAAKAEADAEQKKVTETQTQLNSALATVQSAASGTTTDTTPTTITSGTVNATNATVTSGNKAATGDAAVKATATDSNSTTDAGSTTK